MLIRHRSLLFVHLLQNRGGGKRHPNIVLLISVCSVMGSDGLTASCCLGFVDMCPFRSYGSFNFRFWEHSIDSIEALLHLPGR